MAILWVRRKTGAELSTGVKGECSFRTNYTVKSDSPRELRSGIIADSRLPQYGSVHPENMNAVCVKVNPVQSQDDPHYWNVSCEWNTDTSGNDPNESQKQPDLRRQKWSFNFTPIQKSVFKDLDGKPFMDAAGTPFNPPPNIPIFVDEVTITRYQATCDRRVDRQYMNATNLDLWVGAEPSEVLIADISANEVYEQGAWWHLYVYKMLVNPRIELSPGEFIGGWDPYEVLNAGPRILNDDDPPKAVPVKSADNIYDGQPALLDMDGHQLFIDSDGTIRTGTGVTLSNLYYIKFRTVNKVNFAPLNLYPPWA